MSKIVLNGLVVEELEELNPVEKLKSKSKVKVENGKEEKTGIKGSIPNKGKKVKAYRGKENQTKDSDNF